MRRTGGPEVFEFSGTQVPAPGPHEVRIKIKAIGIHRAESMWRKDQYVEPVRFLAGLGYDAAGIVDAVGKDVTDFAAGDTVSTTSAFSKNKYFTYGKVILAPVYAVVKHPKALSFIDAASIWMVFMTACGAPITDAKSPPFKNGPASAARSGAGHAHR
jgi:NADPH:quinone reductase-like Zn-dependent oxidoreductase